jgi:polyketide biosynthesis acyl carrier protein
MPITAIFRESSLTLGYLHEVRGQPGAVVTSAPVSHQRRRIIKPARLHKNLGRRGARPLPSLGKGVTITTGCIAVTSASRNPSSQGSQLCQPIDEAWMDKELIWADLQRHIVEVLPFLDGSRIDPSARLADLGANSVDRMEIVTLTAESLNSLAPLHELATADRLADLVELLHRKTSVTLKC